MRNISRANEAARPFETTAARLLTALGGYNDEAEASLSMLRVDAGAAARLQRARERIAQHAVEAQAVYAIALAERRQGRSPELSLQRVIAAGEAAGLFLVSDAPAPKLAQLVEPFETRCPRCDGLMRTMTPTGCEMAVAGSAYGYDADCIPGVPAQFAGCASAAMATVGKCPHCTALYWSLDLVLHTDLTWEAVEAIWADDPEWDASFTVGANWTAHAITTESGRGYEHFIGPMIVPASMDPHGSNGVSACRGGAFWQHALAVFEAYRPRLEAVQRELVQAVSGSEGMPA